MYSKPKEKNPRWLGEKAGYQALHEYAKKYWGKPNKCEVCRRTSQKKTKNGRNYFEWANLSGYYRRVRGDWQMQCRKCNSNGGKSTVKKYRLVKGGYKKI